MSARAALLKKLAESTNLAVERAVEIALAEAGAREQTELAEVLLQRNQRAGWVAMIRAFHKLDESIRQKLLERPRDLFGPLAETMGDAEGHARENVITIVQQCTDVRLVYLLAEALMDSRTEVRSLAGNSLLEVVRRYWERIHGSNGEALPDAEDDAQIRRALDVALRHFKTHRQVDALLAALIHERQQDATLWAYFQDPYDDRTRAATILLRAPSEPALAPALLLALGSGLKPAAMAGVAAVESVEIAGAMAENSFRLIDPVLREAAQNVPHLKMLGALRKDPPWNIENWADWLRLIEAFGLPPAERFGWLGRFLQSAPDVPQAVAWKMAAARAIAGTEQVDAALVLGTLARDADERVARFSARLLLLRNRIDWRQRAAELLPKSPHECVRQMAALVKQLPRESDNQPARTHAKRGFERAWNEYQKLPPAMQHTSARNVAADAAFNEQLRAKLQGSAVDVAQALKMLTSLPELAPYRNQIIALCGHAEPRIAAMAVRLVGKLEDPKLKDLLEAATHHADARVRANAVESMEELHIADRSQRVLAMLNSRHSRERANAIKAIGSFDFTTAKDCLSRMLTDSSPLHRMSALWVVSQLNLVEVMRQVSNIARRDPNLRVRNRAVEMMESLGGAVRQ
ncbi:MAG TPA: HEAT repeat domain-containing protein [Phycisphaerae bacterium]|nr:HEAT repeat domain-containing protein [Phycisphaerae bacterium]